MLDEAAREARPRTSTPARCHEVARDLVGCVVRHGETAGRIVETESYHMDEPACHAHVGRHRRARSTLFGPPGRAYVYLSYGIHALLNAVAEDRGRRRGGVDPRARAAWTGIDLMRARRGLERVEDLCIGPGQAHPGARASAST